MHVSESLNIVFMGSAAFSIPVIEAIHESHHQLKAIYCQRPKPAGRGYQEQKCATHIWADEHNIPVITPKNFKQAEDIEQFQAAEYDLAIVAAYGLILPQSILDAPKYGCINVHASLLPRWRGASPINMSILSGDSESGVTLMQMDIGLDTGDMVYKIACPITDGMSAGHLHDKLAVLGKEATAHYLKDPFSKEFSPVKQPEEGVTYASKITRDDAKIDWSLDAQSIMRVINGYNPWPVAWSETDKGDRLKIFEAEQVEIDHNETAGVILDDQLTIACGDGAIRILSLQRPGKKRQSSEEFSKGYQFSSFS